MKRYDFWECWNDPMNFTKVRWISMSWLGVVECPWGQFWTKGEKVWRSLRERAKDERGKGQARVGLVRSLLLQTPTNPPIRRVPAGSICSNCSWGLCLQQKRDSDCHTLAVHIYCCCSQFCARARQGTRHKLTVDSIWYRLVKYAWQVCGTLLQQHIRGGVRRHPWQCFISASPPVSGLCPHFLLLFMFNCLTRVAWTLQLPYSTWAIQKLSKPQGQIDVS